MSRPLALALVWTLPSALFVALTAIVYTTFRIAPPARLDAAQRTAVIAPLRAAIAGSSRSPCTVHAAGGPIAVTVWLDGRAVARVDGDGADLAAAVDAAAARLQVLPDRARIQVDVVVGRAPLGSRLFDALALPGIGDILAIDPGVEGIGGAGVLVLPHELVAMKLLATSQPSEALPDFAMGVDLARIATVVAARARHPVPIGELFRFRTDAFVERPGGVGAPIPLVRGIPPAPPLSAATLRDAALAGGRYLVGHLAPSGRYIYEHDLATGQRTDPARATSAYSMPRHAGTTYFLAELYRITKQPWLREPIERAIAHLVDLLAAGHCGGSLPDGTPFDCVLDRGETEAELGSTALAVVALVEYQRATGDPRYLPLATKLASWLLYMQRPDGSFRHRYDPRTKLPDDNAELLYYSGEAALALARMHAVTGDVRYRDAAGRALDWLVDWYDFFMAGFFYGEEHWTCIAAEAIWPAVQRAAYREFCDGYGAFLRDEQATDDDVAGAYAVTPFLPPYNTPAGSRTEAMISAYLLDRDHGAPDPEIRGQIRAALAYLLGQQIRPDGDFAVVGDGDGGIPESPISRSVRIDYVQHVCSAMIRASEWIDQ